MVLRCLIWEGVGIFFRIICNAIDLCFANSSKFLVESGLIGSSVAREVFLIVMLSMSSGVPLMGTGKLNASGGV